MENYKNVAILFGFISLVLAGICVVLFVIAYNSLQDNATLQYEIASIVSEHSQEKTFMEIDSELQTIKKLVEENKCDRCKIKSHGLEKLK